MKSEYLKEWKAKKLLEDPEYFKRASIKAAGNRKRKLEENPELADEVSRRALENRKKARKIDPRMQLLADARKRAKKEGIEYSLTKESLSLPSVCPVLGIILEVGDGQWQASSPSIDRIDNTKGYIEGNVAIISLRANALKNDGTIDEFKAIIEYMEKNNGMVCD